MLALEFQQQLDGLALLSWTYVDTRMSFSCLTHIHRKTKQTGSKKGEREKTMATTKLPISSCPSAVNDTPAEQVDSVEDAL